MYATFLGIRQSEGVASCGSGPGCCSRWRSSRSVRPPPLSRLRRSRYDPATPLRGAQDATAELGNAGLLIVEGAGHTGMFVPSTCGERAKREYLFTGVLPAPGT